MFEVKKWNWIVLCFVATTITACGHQDMGETKKLVNHSLTDMQYIKGGQYTMGYKNAGATVSVKNFYISKYNVSYEKFDLYTKITDKEYVDAEGKKYHVFDRAPNHPVNLITWYQANDYCQFLAKKTGLPYDLPTAAQWEYVGRNGGKSNWNFPTNNGKQELGKNFPSIKQLTAQPGNNSGDPAPLPVGSLPCTPMGVCGMSRQVSVWLKDWAVINKTKFVQAGGIDNDSSEYANNFNRYPIAPSKKWGGFRCVINSDKPMQDLKQIVAKKMADG